MSRNTEKAVFCLGEFVFVISEIKVGKRKKPKQIKNIGYIAGKDDTENAYKVITIASLLSDTTELIAAKNLEPIPVSMVRQSLYDVECDNKAEEYALFVNSYNSYQYKTFELPPPINSNEM